MKVTENVSLKDFTTLKVGGNARFFVRVEDEQDLRRAFAFAQEKGLATFVLGGGSNTFFADAGFDGLVIKIDIRGREYQSAGDETIVDVGAGEEWDALVSETAERGLWGIENLSLIPGTVGAAPVQNIGAYGAELSSVLREVRVFNIATGEFHTKRAEECGFGYRTSIFKEQGGVVITHVSLKLRNNGRANILYAALATEIEKQELDPHSLTPGQVRDVVIGIRSSKLPDWNTLPTAGSFFKNPEVPSEAFAALKNAYPELPGFEMENGQVKVPLAWIIENICDMKGVCHGAACVYEKHALVLVNCSNASAKEIIQLAHDIAECVKTETGIEIEREVQFVD